ncbi:hypothetical protein PLESTF_000270000 [Pleodorina starrii]|nr:hypothetical protein PLESTM_001223400 [Pleodorina starrii]GLC65263.1 hypothetical protein PLESTF_000270000 [Pleodorina starrii]
MASSAVHHRVGVGLLERLDSPLNVVSKRSDQNTLESPLEPMTSTTPSTTSEGPEQPEIVEIIAPAPTVSNIESHSATFSWTPVCKVPAGFMALYTIELQQLESLDSVPGTNWLSVYKGEGLSCKVDDVRSGRRYAARLVVEVVEVASVENASVEVRVRNADAAFFQTPATVPSCIQPPSLSQRARNALKLKWNVPEDPGGQFELVYVLQISPAPLGFEDQRVCQGFVEVYRGQERSFRVTKLQPGVRYTSRVQAVNPLGEGPFSLCSAYTTQATVPMAPEPPTVQAAASNALTLQWIAPPDNGSPIICYSLERDNGMGGEFQHCYAGPNTWHTVKDLKPGTPYRFRLRADNDEGRSMWSATVALMTGAAPPDSPAALQVVTPLTTSATLAWSAPEHDYGSKVTAYEVELQANSRAAVACMGSAWLKIFEGEALACTINSLCPGCTYRVRVRARNSAGWGVWAVPVTLTTAPDVPETPHSLQPTSSSPTTIVITWAPPRHDGGSKVQRYRMEMASAECLCGRCPPQQPLLPSSLPPGLLPPPGGPGSPAAPVKPVLCPAQAPLVVYDSEHVGAELRHLQPGCRYIFRLHAANAQGASPWTDWVAGATTPDVPVTPAPPAVTGVASGALILSWQAPPGQGAPVTHYTVEVAPLPQMPNFGPPGPAGIIADQRLIAGLCFKVCYRGPHTGCEVRGLEPKCAYALRLCAHNDVGPSSWSVCTAAITSHAAPTCPVSVSAQPASSCKIVLCWMPPERDNGAAVLSYTVEMAAVSRNVANRPGGAGSGAASWSHLYTGPACACAAEGLSPARTYQFRVRATNMCGCGPSSAVVTATTLAAPPSAPGKPVITARTAHNIRVRWDEPEHSYGAIVKSYKLEGALAGTDDWTTMYEGPETAVKVANLQPATKYLLRVAAENAAGEGVFSECEAVTTALMAPLSPTGVTASEATDDALAAPGSADAPAVTSSLLADGARTGSESGPSLQVAWQEPQASSTHAAVMGYEVEARPRPGSDVAGGLGGGVVKLNITGRRCEARLEGVAPGCTYAIRVRSVGVDGAGHSGWSEEASVAVQPRHDADAASVCSSAAGGGAAAASGGAAPRKNNAAARRAAKRQQAAAAASLAGTSASSAQPAAAPGAVVAVSSAARAPSTSGDEAAAAPASSVRARSKATGSAMAVRRPGSAAPGAALPPPRKASWLVRFGESSRITEEVYPYLFGRNWRRDADKQLKKFLKYVLIVALLALSVLGLVHFAGWI